MDSAFDYTDDSGRRHHVWIADAPALSGAKKMIMAAGFAGWGLWRLGLEDPLVWTRASPSITAMTVQLSPSACEPLPR